jgi:hypothetical protein
MIYMELENKEYATHKVMKYLTKLRGNINVQQKYIYSKKLDHWVNVMVGGTLNEIQREKFLYLLYSDRDNRFNSLFYRIKDNRKKDIISQQDDNILIDIYNKNNNYEMKNKIRREIFINVNNVNNIDDLISAYNTYLNGKFTTLLYEDPAFKSSFTEYRTKKKPILFKHLHNLFNNSKYYISRTTNATPEEFKHIYNIYKHINTDLLNEIRKNFEKLLNTPSGREFKQRIKTTSSNDNFGELLDMGKKLYRTNYTMPNVDNFDKHLNIALNYHITILKYYQPVIY